MGEAERGAAIVGVVPNFSEGRRAEVIEAICDALAVPGARLVYRQADAEHHRLDTTVLGSADAVRRSALAGAAVAVESIDLRQHRGAHPRMGAVDVVPFMPVRGVAMDDVVALARDAGQELADALRIPVYFYGEAATSPERRSLADVRRGGYEALREAVASGERLPDLGPHALGPAGAVAVGARMPLVAFNIYLAGDDAAAADAIAREVRESGGGLPAVRAIGFGVPDRDVVTVSMNLVDHTTTGVRQAFDAVAANAAGRGLDVLDSEIVGLAPAAALADNDAEHVRLRGFDPNTQILERLLEEDP
jgi:glutamate formiminotransferase